MWRELLRKKQQLSDEECIGLLKSCKRGFIAVNGDDGYPYVSPSDYFYDEQDGCLYFHGGWRGHKKEAIHRDPRVSFAIIDDGTKENEQDWWYIFKSVVVFGRIEFFDDDKLKEQSLRKLSAKFTDDEVYVQREIDREWKATQVYRLVPEHITGKWVREN